MLRLRLGVEGVKDWDVRGFSAHEALSSLFDVTVAARHQNDNIDLESLVGRPAFFAAWDARPRVWHGVCSRAELVHAEPGGLSTYQLRIAPKMWLTKRRRRSRIFRGDELPTIVRRVLRAYAIKPRVKLTELHEEHECRAQYQERDFELINRLLEEEGISYFFAQVAMGGEDERGFRTDLVLSDKPEKAPLRGGGPIDFRADPTLARGAEYVTAVRVRRSIQPGRFTIRDFDFVHPDRPFFGRSKIAPAPEDVLEQYRYDPAAFIKGRRGKPRTVADPEANRAADIAIEAVRNDVTEVDFLTNAIDLSPGTVIAVGGHPRQELASPVLVTQCALHGSTESSVMVQVRAVPADRPFGPSRRTPKPLMRGPQSATVVRCKNDLGRVGEESIHTDEYGRVCVRFHWETKGR